MERVAGKRAMTRNEVKRRKLLIQRLMAAVLLVMSAVFVWMTASTGEDIGGGLIMALMGFGLLFTRRVVIY